MHKADGMVCPAIKFILTTYMHFEASRLQLDARGTLFIAYHVEVMPLECHLLQSEECHKYQSDFII
jgi:hypothetical protein